MLVQGARSVVISINTTLEELPPFSILTEESSKLLELFGILPCIEYLVAQLSAVNESLFELPPELEAADEIFVLVNSSINPVLEQIEELDSLVESFQAEQDKLNATKIVSEIDDVQKQIDDQISIIEGNDLVSTALQAEDEVRSINWTITQQVFRPTLILRLSPRSYFDNCFACERFTT